MVTTREKISGFGGVVTGDEISLAAGDICRETTCTEAGEIVSIVEREFHG